MDLAKFFDSVNHDRLTAVLERNRRDRMFLRLIRRYLRTGIMAVGIVSVREEGTPQGPPLSPILSLIVLYELGARRARPEVLQIRRRLQHLREVAVSRGTRVGKHDQVYRGDAQAAGQAQQERRISPSTSKVSRLHTRGRRGCSEGASQAVQAETLRDPSARLASVLQARLQQGCV